MKNRTKSETIVDYGLYRVEIVTRPDDKKDIYLVVGAPWATMSVRLNINAFWHDITEWKLAREAELLK